MGFFKKVEGEAAIIVSNGVYKQVDIYSRDGFLFAQAGGGFVRLLADGSTSKPKTTLNFMSWGEGEICRNHLGYLCQAGAPNAKPLEREKSQALIAPPEQAAG